MADVFISHDAEVFISHDLARARHIGTQVAVMHRGQIVERADAALTRRLAVLAAARAAAAAETGQRQE